MRVRDLHAEVQLPASDQAGHPGRAAGVPVPALLLGLPEPLEDTGAREAEPRLVRLDVRVGHHRHLLRENDVDVGGVDREQVVAVGFVVRDPTLSVDVRSPNQILPHLAGSRPNDLQDHRARSELDPALRNLVVPNSLDIPLVDVPDHESYNVQQCSPLRYPVRIVN